MTTISFMNSVISSKGNDERQRLECNSYLTQKVTNTLGASLTMATVPSIIRVKRLVVTMDLDMQHVLISLGVITD